VTGAELPLTRIAPIGACALGGLRHRLLRNGLKQLLGPNRLRSLERLAPMAELGAVIMELGDAARELVLAGCDCANTLQEGLLQPSSLRRAPLTPERVETFP
jgi:hypothetical protein